MTKKLFSIFLLAVFSLALAGCSQKISAGDEEKETNKKPQTVSAGVQKSSYPISSAETAADKLEVYYFHRTARCYSCKTIGRYVKEIMEGKYGEQLKNGKIDYREINIDLPESKEVAEKYQASGSSLFINRIKDSKDNIEPDMNVWKLLGNETEFKNFLQPLASQSILFS